MVYAKEKCRGVCLSKFECDKIKQFINEMMKGENQ